MCYRIRKAVKIKACPAKVRLVSLFTDLSRLVGNKGDVKNCGVVEAVSVATLPEHAPAAERGFRVDTDGEIHSLVLIV